MQTRAIELVATPSAELPSQVDTDSLPYVDLAVVGVGSSCLGLQLPGAENLLKTLDIFERDLRLGLAPELKGDTQNNEKTTLTRLRGLHAAVDPPQGRFVEEAQHVLLDTCRHTPACDAPFLNQRSLVVDIDLDICH